MTSRNKPSFTEVCCQNIRDRLWDDDIRADFFPKGQIIGIKVHNWKKIPNVLRETQNYFFERGIHYEWLSNCRYTLEIWIDLDDFENNNSVVRPVKEEAIA